MKSLNKAKLSLLRGDKLRNPFGDNVETDENNDNLLFREQKSNFSLKKILTQKILEGEKLNKIYLFVCFINVSILIYL